eukprot:1211104-Rhodomonas_salina.1
MDPCSVCMVAKSRAHALPKKAESSKVAHHLVHSDSTGCMQVRSIRGFQYFSVFVDDATDYKSAKCHAAKSDYSKVFKESNVHLGRAPQILRTDGAGEMTSAEFEAELSAMG